MRKLFFFATLFLSSPLLADITSMLSIPGGTNGAVQFNDAFFFGGDSEFTYSTATKTMSVSSITANYISASTVTIRKINFSDGTSMTTAASGSGGGSSIYPATATASFPLGLSASTITVPIINGNTLINGSLSVDNSGSNPLTITNNGSTFGGAFPINATFNNENSAPFNSWAWEFQSAGVTNGYFFSGNNQQNNFYSADKSKFGGFYFGGTGVHVNIGDAGFRSDGSGNLEVKTPGGTQKKLTASDLNIGNLLSATSLATNSSGDITAGNAGILTATQTWSGGNTYVTRSTFNASIAITNLGPGVLYAVAGSSVVESAASGIINTSTNPVDWTLLKNVPAGFADGTDNTGGGGGTTITVQEGGSTVVETSTLTFNSAQFTITDSAGKASIVIDTITAGGLMALSTGTNAAGQLVRLDGNADVPDANLSANVSLLGSQIDISGETNLTVEAPILLVGDDVRIDKSSATLLGPTITIGTETDGIYVASLTATSPITLTGTNNVESAAPIISLAQNVGTDITADLEEETHASEHQDGGSDEISVTGLSGLLADRQKIQISTGGAEVAISSGINFIAGTNVTLSGAYSSANGRVDITINSSGGGGGGSSSLAVGTGTATNFTNNVTSPTAAISFHGDYFRATTNGTTSFITLAPKFSQTYTPLQIVTSSGTLGIQNSTTTRPMALYDASAHEWADWQSLQLKPYSGGALSADIAFTMASATSGGVTWSVQLECIASGASADYDTASFDTFNSTSGATVPATAGYLKVVTVPLTNNDSCASGDSFRPRLNRLPADSGDTASGDAEFRWMRIYE